MKKQLPTFELGLYMLVSKDGNLQAGSALTLKERLNEILQAAKLADEMGLDVFGIGGYTCNEYAIASPSVIISHITSFIELINATTADTVRLYELLEAQLESLSKSVKVETNIDSAAQAGKLGVNLALAVLGGDPEQFKRIVDAYRQEAAAAAVPASQQQVTVTGHMYLAESDALAERQFYPYYRNYWREVHAQREGSNDMTPEQFHLMSTPDSALLVGSPELVIEKILQQHELYGHTRLLARVDIGGLPFKYIAKNIEYLAERIAPVIRKELCQ